MAGPASTLEAHRARYAPRLPASLAGDLRSVVPRPGPSSGAAADADAVRRAFPRTYGQPSLGFAGGHTGPGSEGPLGRLGVVLSGGQAPGGHNVIAGLLDGARKLSPGAGLVGFLGGPKGIFTERVVDLTPEVVDPYRNSGGFDLIGSGRDKVETPEQIAACGEVCARLELDGLVIVGGDDSNTNAAVLAEAFLERGLATRVVGVPKTIDGDLRGGAVEMSFGFDTATKVYSELIGNICRDALSAGKYWHFVRLMGRSASHVTLECALATQPNAALIGEEIRAGQVRLRDVVEQLAGIVRDRAADGRQYGVCLVPEGLIEFVPEMRALIDELNRLLAEAAGDAEDRIAAALSPASREVFLGLPEKIRAQLLLDRDAHGNVQVSLIETEALLVESIARRLAEWKAAGSYSGSFKAQRHFFGYEGRCAAPSNFDADYTYALGHVAALLIAAGRTGYLCALSGLERPAAERRPAAVPLTSLMHMESRKGELRPVIGKALVELEGSAFRHFAEQRDAWAREDAYRYPGPIQYFGPPEVTDVPPRTLRLEAEPEG